MAEGSDISLDELLADPIFVMLMGGEGVSQSQARALYEATRNRLRRVIAEATTEPAQNILLNRDEPDHLLEDDSFVKNIYFI